MRSARVWPLDPTAARTTYCTGHQGLGDTAYMKGPLRRYAQLKGQQVYLETPWPQLFWDTPEVRPVRPRGPLYRVQAANVARSNPALWWPAPSASTYTCLWYGIADYQAGRTPLAAFTLRLGLELEDVDPQDCSTGVNPLWGDWVRDLPRPLAVCHPPTLRREYQNQSRCPDTRALQAAIDTAPEYHWVSVAWLAEGEEWLAGPPLEGISARYEAGELHTEALFTLIAKADIVLTGPCFMLPLAATFGTPCFVVFGGGVPPNCLIDARMGGRIGHVSPVPGCWCLMNEHACNKEIQPERVAAAFKEFLGCVAR